MYFFSVLRFLGQPLVGKLTGAMFGRPPVRNQSPGCWRWWTLRILPLLLVLPEVLGTLGRGQVNLLLLALLCGAIGAVLRKRSRLAGVF